MNSEDKFKELLRQKLAAKEFSFDQEKWEKTRQMIDASREKKKRRAGFLILSLLLLTLGVTSLFVFDNQEDALAVSNPAVSLEKVTPFLEKKTDLTPAVMKNSAGVSSKLVSPLKKQTRRLHAINDLPVAVTKPTVITPKSAFSEPTPHTQAVEKASTPPQKKAAPAAPITVNSTPIVPVLTHSQTGKPQTSSPLAVVSQPPVEETETPVSDKQQNHEPPTAVAADEKTVAVSKAEEPLIKNDTLPSLPLTETKAAALTNDSLASVSASVPVIDPEGLLFPKNLFYIEAGGNYLVGWKGQGKRDANGLNPLFGFGYMNFITKKIALSLGAQYSSVGNLNGYSHTSQVTKLGLGEESSITVITPVKMHQLAGVLKLNFVINPKNMIGLGYTLAYLLAMENKVDTYEQRTNFAPQQHTVSKTTGYAEGFSKFDSQLSVFYRRRIYRNLSLNTEFMFGITDIKNNAFFGSGTFERDFGLKLSLIYNLFKK